MFSGYMVNTWIAATAVAVVAGAVGFFVVNRGSTFAAHVLPQGAFAGATGASLIGVNTMFGLAGFAILGALGVGSLSRRGRHDVATALAFVLMLGTGALFVSFSNEYAQTVFSLLFGEVLGVSRGDLVPILVLGAVSISAIGVLYRPLLLSSLAPEIAEARGVGSVRLEIAFLVIVALATAMTVPVVGAFLMFSLMVGPSAAARSVVTVPERCLALSIAFALATVWISIGASYETDWPVGFFVGAIGGAGYAAARFVAPRRTTVRSRAHPSS